MSNAPRGPAADLTGILPLALIFPFPTVHAPTVPVRSVESMRQLSAQLADAERVAFEASATLKKLSKGNIRRSGHGVSMLSDMHGRHHNYLRISLTER